MKLLSKVLGVLSVAVLPAGLLADVIVLTTGARLEGRIEESGTTRDRITFISGSGRIELPVSRIAERIDESDAEDWTRVGNQYLDLKEYTLAIQALQQALEAQADHLPALQSLVIAQDGLTAVQDEKQREVREDLMGQLERVPELIQNEAFEEAERIVNNLLASDIPDETNLEARRQLRDLYLAWGFSRFDKLDYGGAEQRYMRVLEMDPENEQANDRLLSIWERDPRKREDVLQIYLGKIKTEPNNLDLNRKLGDLLYDLQRYQESIEPLRKVVASNRYLAQGYERRLENAFAQTVQDYKRQGDLDKAIGTFEDLLSVFPSHNDTELTVLRYQRDRRLLADDDYDGWALLVKRLYEAGLTEYGVREAELVLRYSPENEVADAVLRTDAMKDLTRINQAFNERSYLVARDMSMRFIERAARFPDLVQQGEELYNRADIEARRQERENRERAQEIAQRGMQYYNEALSFVNQMTSTEVRSGPRPISYRNEAIDRSRRAIDHYQTALRIDPSLGGIEGMDLNARLRDARNLYSSLTDRPAPLPTIRNRSSTSSN